MNARSQRRASKPGFTLVELLVVITIIVILLALLSPALDRAVYQAELAVCGAKVRGLVGSAHTYAADHARRYPYRPDVLAASWQPSHVKFGGIPANPNWNRASQDTRPTLRPYMSLNAQLNCPLAHAIDIEGSGPDSTIFTAYALWFGYQYRMSNTQRFKGMFKMGDRFTWPDEAGRTQTFNLLASDYDIVRLNNRSTASHPDGEGRMFQEWGQDVDNPWVGGGNAGPVAGWVTYTFWIGNDRGTLDQNYGFEDGSVERYSRIQWYDDRLLLVPRYSDDREPLERIQIPGLGGG